MAKEKWGPWLRYVVKYGEHVEHSRSFGKKADAVKFAGDNEGLVVDLFGKGWKRHVANFRKYL